MVGHFVVNAEVKKTNIVFLDLARYSGCKQFFRHVGGGEGKIIPWFLFTLYFWSLNRVRKRYFTVKNYDFCVSCRESNLLFKLWHIFSGSIKSTNIKFQYNLFQRLLDFIYNLLLNCLVNFKFTNFKFIIIKIVIQNHIGIQILSFH